tara:strand:- start:78 stop:209 length:132 start_codon:yes stop_codon:yes gene_type:complete
MKRPANCSGFNEQVKQHQKKFLPLDNCPLEIYFRAEYFLTNNR